jgi:hypothetical protein
MGANHPKQEIVALRIKGKGGVFQDVPVTGALSATLLEWKGLQEGFKGRRIRFPGGIDFAGAPFVFAGIPGLRFPIARSTCDCGPLAERWGWGDHGPRVTAQRGDDPA